MRVAMNWAQGPCLCVRAPLPPHATDCYSRDGGHSGMPSGGRTSTPVRASGLEREGDHLACGLSV